MQEITLAHAAGIFDVRGFIMLRKGYVPKRQAKFRHLAVTLTGVKILDVQKYLQNNFGGTITNANLRYGSKSWILIGDRALRFLQSILPYMKNKTRRDKVEFILKRFFLLSTGGFATEQEYRARYKVEEDWINLFSPQSQRRTFEEVVPPHLYLESV